MARRTNKAQAKADPVLTEADRPRGRGRRAVPAPVPEPELLPQPELVDPEQEAAGEDQINKPWTVKAVSMEARSAASAAAKRAKQTTGVWLSNAILATISIEMTARRGAGPKVTPAVDLDHMGRVLRMAMDYYAGTNQPVPEPLQRRIDRMLAQALGQAAPLAADPAALALAGPTSRSKGSTSEP